MASSSTKSTKSTSASQLLSSLIPNLVIFAVFMIIFIVLRKRQRRVYEPRYDVQTVPKDLKPEESPNGVFAWITDLLKRPHSYIVQHAGTDGYFFLRFLFEFCFISFLGCIILWPILFAINASNSNGLKQLDMLTFANVKDKWRFFAHIFLSWVFFGCIIFIIYRELVYYTTFRHALQTTPLYDSMLSSRTLLLTEIPKAAMEEAELRTYFPTATNVWYAREYKALEKLVKERTKLAKKYEGALSKVLTKAVKTRVKCQKKDLPFPEPADELNKYLKDGKKRPTHKLKFLIGKKVDTLDYGVERLGELNKEINTAQLEHNTNTQLPSVFIEFPSQLEMQKAYQAIPFNKEFKGTKRHVGLAPDDVIWENLSLTATKRRIKAIIANTVLTLTIIFWSIPVAVVGAISNINFLTDKLPWLKFINNMPDKIMGIITSLLPTILLAVLMSLVPPFIRKMGRVSGKITIQQVESYCQQWYFAFQAIQSFLVVTLASSAASAVTKIIENPTSVLNLLQTKLPKASNFYISYLCLYGLTFSSKLLLQMVALILAQFLGKILDKTPRSQWNRYTTLGQPSFSVLYPGFLFVALIALAYAMIAPLIMGFAAVTFLLIWVAYKYTFVYVLQPKKTDARGRNYAMAMFQLFAALYLAEVTLTAMFVFSKNWACVALEGFWILVTAICHVWFKWKFIPLFDAVPISALKYAAGDHTFQYPMYDQGRKEIKSEGQNYWEGGNQLGLVESPIDQVLPETGVSDADVTADVTASASVAAGVNEKESSSEFKKTDEDPSIEGPTSTQKASSGVVGSFKGFFKPKSVSFDIVRERMPAAYFNYIEYNPDFVRTAYDDPAVTDEEPHIWVPKDEMGLAEIEKNKALENGVDVTDADAGFNEKGEVVYFGPPPSYEEALRV